LTIGEKAVFKRPYKIRRKHGGIVLNFLFHFDLENSMFLNYTSFIKWFYDEIVCFKYFNPFLYSKYIER